MGSESKGFTSVENLVSCSSFQFCNCNYVKVIDKISEISLKQVTE